MKGRSILLGAAILAVLSGVIGYFATATSEAQGSASARFEYAVINGSYSPSPGEGPGVVSSAVNVCYLQPAGCRNEEIRADVNIGKFAQDERLENNSAFPRLAQERAVQTAYARALARLGNEGWEMVDAPQIEFDLFYTNPQGVQTVKEGARTDRRHVWLKRER